MGIEQRCPQDGEGRAACDTGRCMSKIFAIGAKKMPNRVKFLISFFSIAVTLLVVCCSTSQSSTQSKKTKCLRYQDASVIDQYRIEFAYAVNKNWIAPKQMESTNDKIYTSVVFKIMPNGSIKDVFFADESGDIALDKSAIDAIKRTDPFKPYPKELTVPYVEMGLRFSPNGVR